MSYKMSKYESFKNVLVTPKTKEIKFYGRIVNAVPCMAKHTTYNNGGSKSIGYTFTIKTTNYYFDGEIIYPIYAVVMITHKKSSRQSNSLYEWFKKYNGLYKNWLYNVKKWKADNIELKDQETKYYNAYCKWKEENNLHELTTPYAPVKITNASKNEHCIGTNKYFKSVDPNYGKIIFVYLNQRNIKITQQMEIPKRFENIIITSETDRKLISI